MAARVEAQRAVMLGPAARATDWGLVRRGGPALDPDLFARAVLALAEAAARLLLDDPAHFP